MTLAATYLGANGWLLEIGSLRILVDPWLRGMLSFPPGPWFLRGELGTEQPIPGDLDLLPRDLPVVGSAAAARVVKSLGFHAVTELKPGESSQHQQLTIRATAGAPVPQVENGYLLHHPDGQLYLEPHGFLDPSLPPQPLDAVITPMVDLGLPLAGAFVKGCSVVPELVKRFQPRTVLASTSGGDVRFEGALSSLLQMAGSAAETATCLPAETRWLNSSPGETYQLR
jgi:L-ascorbate metabolism protein UlaG (beta-lactamase superfamily)